MLGRKEAVTMKGQPLTLVGRGIKVGDLAPDAVLAANDLSEVELSSYRNKVCVIYSVPSLDTSVCDESARRFNEEAAELSDDVVVIVVSCDLPFAQKRWCGAAGIENVITLSDHRNTSFGAAYGVLIKELRLLTRAVFIVGKDGIIRYEEVVPEIADKPDFEKVKAELKSMLAPA